ncbi:MAG: endolytic transglycosylase MltG [Gemmatimonadaceae bacterium]
MVEARLTVVAASRLTANTGCRRGRHRLAVAALSLAVIACAGGSGTTRVVIPPGATFRVAADSLHRAGVIGSTRLFRFYASIRGHDRRIRAGTYVMSRSMSWPEVVSALTQGTGLIHSITVPEGYSIADIASLLARTLGVAEDSVLAAARDSTTRERLDVPTTTLEGYLFPDTYSFPDGTTGRAAVEAMVRRFEQVWQPEWNAKAEQLALSRHDILTLASIVEKEAKLPAERPVIAAVYLNRLRTGMRLQADPTVQYALGRHSARLYYKDLRVDSPYNTYEHAGLPPGPIASPGRASIIAALEPAAVPYRYFVAHPDGHHEFHVDYQSHERAVAAVRREREAAARNSPQVPNVSRTMPGLRPRRR